MNGELFRESRVRIPTPEQVFLEYPLAGLARRALATLLDSIIISVCGFALILLTILLIASLEPITGVNAIPSIEAWFIALFIAYLILLLLGPLIYFGLFEYYWNGQTPGKRAARIRVIRSNGLALDRTAAALRNLFRLVDLLPSSYLAGIWSVMLTSRQQRLGDLVADTIVIALPLQRDIAEVREGTATLSSSSQLIFEAKREEEARLLLEQYLRRREGLEPAARLRIARMLAARFGIAQPQALVSLEQQLYWCFTSP